MATRRKIFQTIAEFLVVGICTLAFALTALGIVAAMLGSDAAGSRDFVEYWASGHLLAHHANPYDAVAILGLERSAGYPPNIPVLILWNPPWSLLLVLPLGFVGPRADELLWSLLTLASLVAAVRIVWIMYGRPQGHLNWLGYSFAPALACLLAGQVSLFVLLGLVLFLRLHRSSPFFAGVFLWLCLLKPHLFLPFGVVLLLWAIINRQYRLLLGSAVALGVSTGIVLLLDPLVWFHYRQMVGAARIAEAIPCWSILLRLWLSPNTLWLQYLPATLGCIWALAYFRKHRANWDWVEHGSPLMLVSVLVAPYSWLMDQAILIPALLHAAYISRSRGLLALLAFASAVIEIGPLRGISLLHSAFYLWSAPAWLAWYLWATRSRYAMTGNNTPGAAGDGCPAILDPSRKGLFL